MTDAIGTPKKQPPRGEGLDGPRTRLVRGDWSPRGAITFWLLASGLVWIALAVSAGWVG
jgi:hypothetical protein